MEKRDGMHFLRAPSRYADPRYPGRGTSTGGLLYLARKSGAVRNSFLQIWRLSPQTIGGTVMSLLIRVIAGGAFALTAACQHDDPNTTSDIPVASLLPVSDVANAIKCELAETFANRRYVAELVHTPVTGTLSLKEVMARKIEGEGGLEGTVLGVTIGATGGLSRERTGTNSLKVGFSYAVSDTDPVPSFCAGLTDEVRVQGDPFVTILDGIKTEHAEIVAGNPKVTLGSVEYTAGFDIAKSREGGGEVSLLIFKVGGKAGRTSTSSQELTLEFKLKLPPTLLR